MKISAALVSMALALSACAIGPEPTDTRGNRLDFALIGDMPYDGRQEGEFTNLMKDIDAADLAFVVHNGDFWWDGGAWTEKDGGLPPCSDATFDDRLQRAQRSKHPFVYVVGDNEWADCHRAKPRTYDPLERLAKLRRMYFPGNQSLGQSRISLKRQSDDNRYASYRENARWTFGEVVFVTLQL